MAKLLVFLLALALAAATNAGAVSATAVDEDDLAQRRETMAELVRIFSNPVTAAAADTETVYRLAAFMKREIGPLGTIVGAIRNMPEDSAADARSKEEASDAAFELVMRHFRQLMPQGPGKTDDL
ncbi:hypothetical protein QYE76_058720 [Lolium multiflorum]|uniref:Uncharacterized protein n=1 Tax=Lolium multiflorum TaxID=4521 RepID=A0AAD8T5Z4_LOLMU|nr:hypothetical protein QYE76_058720 [Lolium multiflorum]